MQVREEFLQKLRIVAKRIHDVIPTGRVDGTCDRRDGGDRFRFEYVRCGQGNASHVHHVEDAMRPGQIVGGHDHQRDLVDQIRGETASVVVFHLRKLIEDLSCIDGDVALRVGFDVAVAQVEQSLQIAFLHIHAEEVGVSFAQFQTRLRLDAAQFVAWLENKLVETADKVRVGFQLAQYGDDDGQRDEALLSVDDLVSGRTVLDENQGAQKVGAVRIRARVLQVAHQLRDVVRLPCVGALEGRDGELIVGGEHFAQRLFRGAD